MLCFSGCKKIIILRENAIYFVDPEKAFDRVPKKLFELVMRMYEGARTRVRVDSKLSEDF